MRLAPEVELPVQSQKWPPVVDFQAKSGCSPRFLDLNSYEKCSRAGHASWQLHLAFSLHLLDPQKRSSQNLAQSTSPQLANLRARLLVSNRNRMATLSAFEAICRGKVGRCQGCAVTLECVFAKDDRWFFSFVSLPGGSG
jgi:hypothetical protein